MVKGGNGRVVSSRQGMLEQSETSAYDLCHVASLSGLCVPDSMPNGIYVFDRVFFSVGLSIS